MKERPILFSAPMVRAILSGQKTQTRRVVKYQPVVRPDLSPSGLLAWMISVGTYVFGNKSMPEFVKRCPYGQPGDRLWVRETWQGPLLESDEQIDEFRQSPDTYKKPGFCAYRATDTLDAIDQDGKELGWRPSIHMPRWASRILLEVTGVRVERLQDISEEDAAAEGIHFDRTVPFNGPWFIEPSDPQGYLLASSCYEALWDQINGTGSWDANPWVWVVEFKRLEGGAA